MKENIVIRACREAYDFVFRLRVKGVVPVLNEGGRVIDFYEEKEKTGEKIFRIPAPLMTDATGIAVRQFPIDWRNVAETIFSIFSRTPHG